MAMVLIRCPITNLPVGTGLFMDESAFEAADILEADRRMTCPLCQQTHVWDKDEAYLVEDEESLAPSAE